MNIETFIRERRATWKRLEELLDLADSLSERELGHARVLEIVTLYRQASADLNRARSYTANPELIGRLNQLTGRAYRFVYRYGHQRSVGNAFRRLVLTEIPATFRREWRFIAAAAFTMALGAAVGAFAVFSDPQNGERLIPAQFFSASPRERVEAIEQEEERIADTETAAVFAAALYTHNIQVSLLAFSLGALTILGGYWILFYNGVILGAVASMYVLDGVTVFFLAWVGPHGALELPAIVFGAAAGLRAGHALLMPGELSRGSSLRQAFPAVWRMLAASGLILVCAGIIEGSFSQFSAKTFAYEFKIAVAGILFAALLAYLFFPRRDTEMS